MIQVMNKHSKIWAGHLGPVDKFIMQCIGQLVVQIPALAFIYLDKTINKAINNVWKIKQQEKKQDE